MMALTIVGLIAIAMLEGLSGLLQLFPAPNALVEYVKYFVDEDLAYVVYVEFQSHILEYLSAHTLLTIETC